MYHKTWGQKLAKMSKKSLVLLVLSIYIFVTGVIIVLISIDYAATSINYNGSKRRKLPVYRQDTRVLGADADEKHDFVAT